MSHLTSRLRALGAAGAVALTALAAASSACAATVVINAQCTFPLVGQQPVTVEVDVPSTVSLGQPASALYHVSSVTSSALAGLGASVTAVGTLNSVLLPPQGFATSLSGDFPYPLTAPIDGPKVPATGPGSALLVFSGVKLNVAAKNAAGDPILLPTSGVDSDSDPATTDVPCAVPILNPSTTLTLVSGGGSGPTQPGPLTVTQNGSGSVTVSWGASTDDVGVVKYRLSGYGSPGGEVAGTETSFTWTRLVAGQSYEISVAAIDTDGNISAASTTTFVVDEFVPVPIPSFAWDAVGSASLKARLRGSVPLRGRLSLEVEETGFVSGELKLQPASARLTALGFLPVTARLEFLRIGITAGTLTDGVLATDSQVLIKLAHAKLFGWIPLVTGNTCVTRTPSDINLTSAPGFEPEAGGVLTGRFATSNLVGCGGLNGLIGPLTSGTGNTISLKLDPTAPTSN